MVMMEFYMQLRLDFMQALLLLLIIAGVAVDIHNLSKMLSILLIILSAMPVPERADSG